MQFMSFKINMYNFQKLIYSQILINYFEASKTNKKLSHSPFLHFTDDEKYFGLAGYQMSGNTHYYTSDKDRTPHKVKN